MTSSPDFHNIQGDIYPGLPKKTESYLFFRIAEDTNLFRKALVDIVPLVTSASKAIAHRKAIKEHQERHGRHGGKLLPLIGTNISFSQTGLAKMDFEDVKDSLFVAGQKADAEALGDAIQGDGKPAWDAAFLSTIDGVIMVTGDSHYSVDKHLAEVAAILGPSIEQVIRIRGDVRPGENKGHEHFGFMDGISDPAIEGFDKTNLPGQEFIPANVIFTDGQAPSLEGGSLLAFRYLLQLVPEFDKFVKERSRGLFDGLGDKESAELLGARMVGRWKSGAPLDITPLRDDPKLAANPHLNNNFRFEGELAANDQARCPFSAHIRKTNPRADLEDPPNKIPTTGNRIIRRGIPFGPEVSEHEKHISKTQHDRGLLFVSYQSNLEKGFAFIQKSWANTGGFIDVFDGSIDTDVPGLDPIIGQKGSADRSFSGADVEEPVKELSAPLWVLPKGGEYFFTPSIATLRDVLANGVCVE